MATDLTTKVVVDARGAVESFNQLRQSIEGAGAATQRTISSVDAVFAANNKLSTSMRDLQTQWQVLNAGIAKGGENTLKYVESLSALRNGFERVQSVQKDFAAGNITAAASLGAMNEALAQTKRETEIVALSTRGAVTELDKFASRFDAVSASSVSAAAANAKFTKDLNELNLLMKQANVGAAEAARLREALKDSYDVEGKAARALAADVRALAEEERKLRDQRAQSVAAKWEGMLAQEHFTGVDAAGAARAQMNARLRAQSSFSTDDIAGWNPSTSRRQQSMAEKAAIAAQMEGMDATAHFANIDSTSLQNQKDAIKSQQQLNEQYETFTKRLFPAQAASKQLAETEAMLANARKSGLIPTDKEHAELVDAAREAHAKYIAELQNEKGKIDEHTGALALNGGALREVFVLMHEMGTGQTSRVFGSMWVLLAERMNLAQKALEAFTSAGPGFLAVGAAGTVVASSLAAIAIAAAQAGAQMTQLRIASQATGGAIGISPGQLDQMAMKASDHVASSNYRNIAIDAMNQGNISATNLHSIMSSAENYAAATGQDVDEAGIALSKAAQTPTKSLQELADKYHVVTYAQVEYVRQLEASGKLEQAQAEYLRLNDERITNLANVGLNALGRALRETATWWKTFWDNAGNLGKVASTEEQLNAVQKKLANPYGQAGRMMSDFIYGDGLYGGLPQTDDALRSQANELANRLANEKKTHLNEAGAAENQKALAAGNELYKQYYPDAVAEKNAEAAVERANSAVAAAVSVKNAYIDEATAALDLTKAHDPAALKMFDDEIAKQQLVAEGASRALDTLTTSMQSLQIAGAHIRTLGMFPEGQARQIQEVYQNTYEQNKNTPHASELANEAGLNLLAQFDNDAASRVARLYEEEDIKKQQADAVSADDKEKQRQLAGTARAQQETRGVLPGSDNFTKLYDAGNAVGLAEYDRNHANSGKESAKGEDETQKIIERTNAELKLTEAYKTGNYESIAQVALDKEIAVAQVGKTKAQKDAIAQAYEQYEIAKKLGAVEKEHLDVTAETGDLEKLTAALAISNTEYNKQLVLLTAIKNARALGMNAPNEKQIKDAIQADNNKTTQQLQAGGQKQNADEAKAQQQFITLGMGKDATEITNAQSALEQQYAGQTLTPKARKTLDDQKAELAVIVQQNQAYAAQKAAMDELANFGTQVFDRIGSSITQAFANGSISALDFKNIGKAVMSELMQEVFKLSVMNPIKNWMEGTSSNPTLAGVDRAVTGMAGGDEPPGGSGSGGVAGGTTAALPRLVNSVFSSGSSGHSGSAQPITIGGQTYMPATQGGTGEGLGDLFGPQTSYTDQISNAYSGSWLQDVFGGGSPGYDVAGSDAPNVIDSVISGSDQTSGLSGLLDSGGLAGGSMSDAAVPGAGSLLTAGMDFVNGNIGAGAGTLGGSAIGTAILPGVGTAIGGMLGGMVGGLFDGGQKSVGPNGTADITYNTDTPGGFGSGAAAGDNGYNVTKLKEQATVLAKQLNDMTSIYGISVDQNNIPGGVALSSGVNDPNNNSTTAAQTADYVINKLLAGTTGGTDNNPTGGSAFSSTGAVGTMLDYESKQAALGYDPVTQSQLNQYLQLASALQTATDAAKNFGTGITGVTDAAKNSADQNNTSIKTQYAAANDIGLGSQWQSTEQTSLNNQVTSLTDPVATTSLSKSLATLQGQIQGVNDNASAAGVSTTSDQQQQIGTWLQAQIGSALGGNGAFQAQAQSYLAEKGASDAQLTASGMSTSSADQLFTQEIQKLFASLDPSVANRYAQQAGADISGVWNNMAHGPSSYDTRQAQAGATMTGIDSSGDPVAVTQANQAVAAMKLQASQAQELNAATDASTQALIEQTQAQENLAVAAQNALQLQQAQTAALTQSEGYTQRGQSADASLATTEYGSGSVQAVAATQAANATATLIKNQQELAATMDPATQATIKQTQAQEALATDASNALQAQQAATASLTKGENYAQRGLTADATIAALGGSSAATVAAQQAAAAIATLIKNQQELAATTDPATIALIKQTQAEESLATAAQNALQTQVAQAADLAKSEGYSQRQQTATASLAAVQYGSGSPEAVSAAQTANATATLIKQQQELAATLDPTTQALIEQTQAQENLATAAQNAKAMALAVAQQESTAQGLVATGQSSQAAITGLTTGSSYQTELATEQAAATSSQAQYTTALANALGTANESAVEYNRTLQLQATALQDNANLIKAQAQDAATALGLTATGQSSQATITGLTTGSSYQTVLAQQAAAATTALAQYITTLASAQASGNSANVAAVQYNQTLALQATALQNAQAQQQAQTADLTKSEGYTQRGLAATASTDALQFGSNSPVTIAAQQAAAAMTTTIKNQQELASATDPTTRALIAQTQAQEAYATSVVNANQELQAALNLATTEANVLSQASALSGASGDASAATRSTSIQKAISDYQDAGGTNVAGETAVATATADKSVADAYKQQLMNEYSRQITALNDNSSQLNQQYGALLKLSQSLESAAQSWEISNPSNTPQQTLAAYQTAFDDAVAKFNIAYAAGNVADQNKYGGQVTQYGQGLMQAEYTYYGGVAGSGYTNSTIQSQQQHVLDVWSTLGGVPQDTLDAANNQINQNQDQISILQQSQQQAQQIGVQITGSLDDLTATTNSAYATFDKDLQAVTTAVQNTASTSNTTSTSPTASQVQSAITAESTEATTGKRLGGLIGYVTGGMVGNGMYNVDSVRARYAGGGDIMLAGGEYVIPAPAVNSNTLPALNAIRAGSGINDNSDMVAELKALRAEVSALRQLTSAGMTMVAENTGAAAAHTSTIATAVSRPQQRMTGGMM